ncbi:DUF3084 domain-containing protein [Meiothermus rufus]|uniref:DUF3084 domain-containing protein n=1 Tax=Meiothermus rufus TaxID=604332 RepID=UPI0003F5E5F1|nr:DUF3084 domain-containing protein [Meiothermus rufus]
MTFWAILTLMVLVAGLVAYVGDQVAKRVGKRHWRFLGLRPRATATLVAVGTGVLIALGAFGSFFLLVRDARETILQAEAVRQERDRLRSEIHRLESRAASIFAQNEQLKTERDEFEKNNTILARQLAQYAELQLQTRQELEEALLERERLHQEVQKLQAASSAQRQALEQLKQVRQSLLREKETLQKEKEQLLTQARGAELQLKRLEAARREAQNRLNSLQARTRKLEEQLRQLEAEKRILEGDVAVLGRGVSQAPPSEGSNRQLEALQRENSDLLAKLNQALRELQQLREHNRLMAASLDKSLTTNLLAEEPVFPGNEQMALSEVTRRAENRVRLIGLRPEIVESPNLNTPKPGVLLARVQGVSAEGRIRVAIEYWPRVQAFAEGDVLASTILVLPARASELQRKFNILRQLAENRLAEAGWVPEKLAQGGIALEEFVNLTTQLTGKRGGVRIAVVATRNLYPTEPPQMGLKVLP